MAAADKARFYLEKAVPDLQELQRKEIFSHDELTTIVKKRSDFEHILNGPGSKPADYLRYAAFEMNLSALRKKRCLRLGVKSTTHNGQRAIFFIFERATKKFPSDQKLWQHFIEYCQKEHANKKLAKVFTSALRLAPRNWALWVQAAKHYAESEGDMTQARDFLQRGIRFNPDEKKLYIEYTKLELTYLAKLNARRRVLGLDQDNQTGSLGDEEADDTIALPAISAAEFSSSDETTLSHLDAVSLTRIAESSMMHGALPVAIFNAATRRFDNSPPLLEQFFRLSILFDRIEPIRKFQERVLLALSSLDQPVPEQYICRALRHVSGIDVQAADYPMAISQALTELKAGQSLLAPSQTTALLAKAILLLLSILKHQAKLDKDVSRAIVSSIRTYVRRWQSMEQDNSIESLVRTLHKSNAYDADVGRLARLCSDLDRG